MVKVTRPLNEVQTILSDGRPQDVAKQAEACSLVVRTDASLRMQIVATHVAGVRDSGIGCLRRRNFHRFHAELQASIVLFCPLPIQEETTAREQSLHARSDALCQRESLSLGERRRRNEMQLAVIIFAIGTIKERGMEMRCRRRARRRDIR